MCPSIRRNTLRAKGINDGVFVLDEIQRLLDFLNEIHMPIEETDIHFLLGLKYKETEKGEKQEKGRYYVLYVQQPYSDSNSKIQIIFLLLSHCHCPETT